MAYVSTIGWHSYFGEPAFLDLGQSAWKRNLVPAVKRDVLLRMGLGWAGRGSGMGAAPSPVGFADFGSFQSAVEASFPPCPPPYDPSCENPRDAAIQAALATWTTNPASCHNVVCDPSGQPAIAVNQPYTTAAGQAAVGTGIQTTSGFIPLATPPVVAAAAPLLAPVKQVMASAPAGFSTRTPAVAPKLTFTNSRGSNSLVVGDTWTITITGAAPGSAVSVTGNTSGSNTTPVTTPLGSTDVNGQFTLSGQLDPSTVGVWAEDWRVGGNTVGHIAFTVSGAPAAPPSPTYHPQLVFITSRGTDALLVGDQWTINITNAAPNSPVTVTGNTSGTSQDSVTTPMGSTDGNGLFHLSGRINEGSEGVWAQDWAVGGQSVGHVAFTVSPSPQSAQPPPSPPPGSSIPPGGTPPPPGQCDPSIDPLCAQAPSPAGFFSQSISVGGAQIPVWAVIVAAGGAVLLLMGEGQK
jgi:hypothetical protein